MSFISKILGNKDEEFREVRVDREVLESVIYYSKKSYPNEFLAFFDGEIKDKVLYITGLIFLPGERSKTSAVIHTEMIPMNTKYMGSVHSHPGPSARRYFHMIVCLPYSLETFKSYDRYGQPMDYTLGDYADFRKDDVDEFFDESDVVTDRDEFKPGFFDEEDDEFFKTLDEERENYYDESEMKNRFDRKPHVEVISNTQMPKRVIKIELNPDGTVKKIDKK